LKLISSVESVLEVNGYPWLDQTKTNQLFSMDRRMKEDSILSLVDPIDALERIKSMYNFIGTTIFEKQIDGDHLKFEEIDGALHLLHLVNHYFAHTIGRLEGLFHGNKQFAEDVLKLNSKLESEEADG